MGKFLRWYMTVDDQFPRLYMQCGWRKRNYDVDPTRTASVMAEVDLQKDLTTSGKEYLNVNKVKG